MMAASADDHADDGRTGLIDAPVLSARTPGHRGRASACRRAIHGAPAHRRRLGAVAVGVAATVGSVPAELLPLPLDIRGAGLAGWKLQV